MAQRPYPNPAPSSRSTAPNYSPALAILSDEDVNKWLKKNAPHVLADISLEESRIEKQRDAETNNAPGGLTWGEELTDGQHYSSLGLPDTHYLFLAFPGCCSEEICTTLRPYLSERQHGALHATFSLGLTQSQAAVKLGLSPRRGRDTICGDLSKVRARVFELFKNNTLTYQEKSPDASEELYLMMVGDRGPQQGIPTASSRRHGYHRPNVIASVCDCGHHLTWRDRVHRRKAGDGHTYTCRCGRRYSEVERLALAA